MPLFPPACGPIRDKILPKIDRARAVAAAVGLRRYAVTVRRRVWSGAYVGQGTPTDQDITISPLPRVRNKFSSFDRNFVQYLLANGNLIDDRYYRIDRITPAYTTPTPCQTFYGLVGGFSSQQLRTRPNPDVKNVEEIVVLVGDDGFKRDCVQVMYEQDNWINYAMYVHETDRPRAALSSIAIRPSPLSILHGLVIQLTATGTFSDSSPSNITPIAQWSSSNPAVATVSLLGVLTAIAAGTTTITASLTGITTSMVVTVT